VLLLMGILVINQNITDFCPIILPMYVISQQAARQDLQHLLRPRHP
jgi:hypothetical protein